MMKKKKPKPKKKLMALHWKKMPKNKIAGSIFDGVEPPEDKVSIEEICELFALSKDEEPEQEEVKEEVVKKKEKVTILDGKKGQKVGIMLSRFRNMTLEQLQRAIFTLDSQGLSAEDMEALYVNRATEEEVAMVSANETPFEDLGTPEQFYKAMTAEPLGWERLNAFAFMQTYPEKFAEYDEEVTIAIEAWNLLKDNEDLKVFFSYVLEVGNWLNAGTFNGDILGFELGDAYYGPLQEMTEITAIDGSCTLFEYVVSLVEKERPDFLPKLAEQMELVNRANLTSFKDLSDNTELFAKLHGEIKSLLGKLSEDGTQGLFKKELAPFLEECGDKPQDVFRRFKEANAAYNEAKDYFEFKGSSKELDVPPTDLYKVFGRFGQCISHLLEERERKAAEKAAVEARLEEIAAKEAEAEAQRQEMARRQNLAADAQVDPAALMSSRFGAARVASTMGSTAVQLERLMSKGVLASRSAAAMVMHNALAAPLPSDLDEDAMLQEEVDQNMSQAAAFGDMVEVGTGNIDDGAVSLQPRICPACARYYPPGSCNEEIDTHIDFCFKQKGASSVCMTMKAPVEESAEMQNLLSSSFGLQTQVVDVTGLMTVVAPLQGIPESVGSASSQM